MPRVYRDHKICINSVFIELLDEHTGVGLGGLTLGTGVEVTSGAPGRAPLGHGEVNLGGRGQGAIGRALAPHTGHAPIVKGVGKRRLDVQAGARCRVVHNAVVRFSA